MSKFFKLQSIYFTNNKNNLQCNDKLFVDFLSTIFGKIFIKINKIYHISHNLILIILMLKPKIYL